MLCSDTYDVKMIIKNYLVILLVILITAFIDNMSGHAYIKHDNLSLVRYLISNDTDAQPFIMTKSVYNYSHKYIQRVLELILNDKYVLKSTFSIQEIIDTFVRFLRIDTICGHTTNQDVNLLKAPCGLMTFMSMKPAYRNWRIHGIFMINITIFEAYIPFTDLCFPHNI